MTVSAVCAQPLAARKFQGSRAKLAAAPKVRAAPRNLVIRAERSGPVTIGLAADSGCGKSTFMRRMTSLFGGKASPPEGGNPDSNTLISDTTTVLCLDDYHLNDRAGRKKSGLTALNLAEQDFGACASGPGPSHQTRQCSARQATRGSFDKDTLGGWDTERSPGWDAGIFLDCTNSHEFSREDSFPPSLSFYPKKTLQPGACDEEDEEGGARAREGGGAHGTGCPLGACSGEGICLSGTGVSHGCAPSWERARRAYPYFMPLPRLFWHKN